MATTLSVNPAAYFPLYTSQTGRPSIINNRGKTEHNNLSVINLRLVGNVGEIFPPAVDFVLNLQ
jgi:hypothetical protein